MLTKKEKERLVIELAEKDCTTREIAKEVRISLGDIGKILKKHNGEEYYDEKLSVSSKAFSMFQDGKSPLQVAIKLNLDVDSTKNFYRGYLELIYSGEYGQLLKDLGPDLPLFIDLYQTLKSKNHLNKDFIKDFINKHSTLDEIKSEVIDLNDFLIKLYDKKLEMEKEIERISKKYHIYY